MARKRSPPASVYQELFKFAQTLARVHEPRPASNRRPSRGPPGGVQSAAPATAYKALATQVARAEAVGQVDMLELARKAHEAAAVRCRELRSSLETLKADRADHEKRRRDLAAVAEGFDWEMVHRDKKDFIGPFGLDHVPERSRLFLGRLKLGTFEYPSGQELFDAVKEHRKSLEASARSLWPTLKARVLPVQGSQGTVTWAQIKAALEQPKVSFKKLEPSVIYALVLLRAGSLEPHWTLSTKPPALAQQARAVVLPRIDKPGAPDKVYAFRIEGPSVSG